MVVYLPKDIQIEIVRRLAKDGFRELAPFIASGPEGRDVAFAPEVLKEVDLDEFIFVSSLANEGSMYRGFFMRCFEGGNVTAKYVEGLRRAVKNGPSVESLLLMHSAEDDIPYASFAYGIFAICNGHYEEGIATLEMLGEKVHEWEYMAEIGEIVMAQIADLEPPLAGHYNETYKYPEGDVPHCVHFACTMDDACFDCIGYWGSLRVRQLC